MSDRDRKVIKTAMIMGAGLGTRMAPLTDTMPKPLVPFCGRPLIDHVLDRLVEAGVEKVVVNLHHFADKLEAHLAHEKRVEIVFSDERDALLDTGGGVKKALPLLGPDPFFVFNSDSVWTDGMVSPLPAMASRWDSGKMDVLMMIASAVNTIGETRRGDFTMDPMGRLIRRQEGTVAPFMYAGVQILNPKLFEGAPDGAFSTNKMWDKAIEAGRLYGHRMDGVWMHLGTPGDIKAAEQFLTSL